MSLQNHDVVSFLATAQADRARVFYGEMLGLTLAEETDFALVFAARNCQLRIQKVSAVSPLPYTAMGWQVDDLETEVAALVGRGVVFDRHDGLAQDGLGIWTSPSGAKVAWFKDPDGNTLSLTQY